MPKTSIAIALFLTSLTAVAAAQAPPGVPSAPAKASPQVTATRATGPITLDGTLNEPSWQQALAQADVHIDHLRLDGPTAAGIALVARTRPPVWSSPLACTPRYLAASEAESTAGTIVQATALPSRSRLGPDD